ncbi:hypothetical protein ACFXG4_23370 [Nocardia sp. NPDC059246]|uniref:hypothetical protein n=1 Tax=unclassified Nocardia TaxID=2637762 RepID=UPI0036BF8908
MAELTQEMRDIARDIAIGRLYDDIEFCDVCERYDVEDFGNDELKAIHGEATRMLGVIADYIAFRPALLGP